MSPAALRPAEPGDADAIGAIYVAVWRSTYAGLLPSEYLTGMSAQRLARRFRSDIARHRPVVVAEVDDAVIGFCAGGIPRQPGLADCEIETLYVLDDHREQGTGRRLLRACAGTLAEAGCGSVFLWVLQDNPSRWFYERLGGRPVRRAVAHVAGQAFHQTAYLWDPIARLLPASTKT